MDTKILDNRTIRKRPEPVVPTETGLVCVLWFLSSVDAKWQSLHKLYFWESLQKAEKSKRLKQRALTRKRVCLQGSVSGLVFRNNVLASSHFLAQLCHLRPQGCIFFLKKGCPNCDLILL